MHGHGCVWLRVADGDGGGILGVSWFYIGTLELVGIMFV